MKVAVNSSVKVPYTKKSISNFLKKLFKNKNWEVSVAVVSPLAIKKINNKYRHKNKVTDVLSFLYEPRIGEIVICYQQVKKQARQHQLSIKEEFYRMLLHGALHLQGHHDDSKLEDKIFKNAKF